MRINKSMPVRTSHGLAWSISAPLISILLTVSGCSRHSDAKVAGQVVASVNDSDITYLQLNYLLQSNGIDAGNPEIVHKTLDALIDQELLVQEALKAKVDRDPEILQALEMARRQILVEAYARGFVYPHAAVTDAEVATYYNANPGLFEKRKLYELNVFMIESETLEPAVMEALDKVKTVADLRTLLQQRHINFSEQTMQKFSEQLPLAMVPQFAKANVGDVLISHPGQFTQLMQVGTIVDQPLTLEQAKSDVDRFLSGMRNREAMQARVEQLRGSAHINYLGDFAAKPALVDASASPAVLAKTNTDVKQNTVVKKNTDAKQNTVANQNEKPLLSTE